MLRTARFVEERAAVESGEVSIFLSAKYLHTPRASRIGRSPFGYPASDTRLVIGVDDHDKAIAAIRLYGV